MQHSRNQNVRHDACRGLICIFALLAGRTEAEAWRNDFHVGRDDGWRQRIPITVTNAGDQELSGRVVFLPVDPTTLADASADALRVADTNGHELLWSVQGPAGQEIRRGPIPPGSTLAVPVECGPRAATRLYVYFDNPSAWPVADFLKASGGDLRNGGFEAGSGGTPAGWKHDDADELHRAEWVGDRPHGGTQCVRTVVAPNAPPSWISTRQAGLRIEGGARYRFSAWVRAENVKGSSGWYLHIGNATNSQLLGPMATAGQDSFDWKEVTAEFTAPAHADRADLGTVLRGTGTAWFDDASLVRLSPAVVSVQAGPVERAPALRETGADAPWPADTTLAFRIPIRVLNATASPMENALVSVDLSPALARLSGRIDAENPVVSDGAQTLAAHRIGQTLLFPVRIEPLTRRTFHLYFHRGDSRTAASPAARREYAANPALPGGETREVVPVDVRAGYASLLASPLNLLRNPSFEAGETFPTNWTGAENKPGAVAMGFESPAPFGARCVKMQVTAKADANWRGWHQGAEIKPGATYLFAAWLKCADFANDRAQLHAHALNAARKICADGGFMSVGPGLLGTQDWTLLQGHCTMPADAVRLEAHLTARGSGTVWHDAALLCEVLPARLSDPEQRTTETEAGVSAWPVNAIVKVFRSDGPPAAVPAARLSAARGEREPLQVALRSTRSITGVAVTASALRGPWGRRLAAPEIGVVGYVPIDHETSYYQSDSPAWHRKTPKWRGTSDGWTGWWPDPILPRSTFDLAAGETQPVWLTFRIPADARPGDYAGTVRFEAGGSRIAEVPYTLRVWDFALPETMHVKAIYDARGTGPQWQQEGMTQDEARRGIWKFMAERRLCPDTVKPEPKLEFRNGQVVADFTAFDAAASYYFDTLKLPHMYTPWQFYGFGWGHPPGKKFGEEPYEGPRPFTNAVRGVLRPEFRQAYQACLRTFWAHLREKGWADKCVLYISDEPYDSQPHIREQMKALCAMIREVDPAIPIYCSTWHHQPEWDGHLTVWGIGHDGRVPVEKLAQIRAGGAKFWWTTDGQLCTDTPYCAIERLLPHYCFKYGADAYEFWGIDWLTYDPYEFGWHRFIHQSGQPGQETWVRYPNGDGYLIYPGAPFGQREPVPSIRVEQAGEGSEDYEYLWLLRDRIEKARAAGRDVAAAEKVLAAAQELVAIPNAGGRRSTQILPDPDAVFRVKEEVARAIESLE